MHYQGCQYGRERLPRPQRRPPAPPQRGCPSVSLLLTPGSLVPLGWRIHAGDYATQERIAERIGQLCDLLAELAEEPAA
jgi:hypothetical protein